MKPDWARIRGLIELGLPAAMQIVFEVGVFAGNPGGRYTFQVDEVRVH